MSHPMISRQFELVANQQCPTSNAIWFALTDLFFGITSIYYKYVWTPVHKWCQFMLAGVNVLLSTLGPVSTGVGKSSKNVMHKNYNM